MRREQPDKAFRPVPDPASARESLWLTDHATPGQVVFRLAGPTHEERPPVETQPTIDSSDVAVQASSQGSGDRTSRPSEGSWLPLLGAVGIAVTVLVVVTVASVFGDGEDAVRPVVTPSVSPSAVQGFSSHGDH